MAELVFHEELEKRARPRRSRPGAPLPAFDPERARKRVVSQWKKTASRVQLGSSGWDPTLLERTRAAIAFLEGRTALPRDLDVLAVVETLARIEPGARPDVVAWIAHEHGVAAAVDAKLRSVRLVVSAPAYGGRVEPVDEHRMRWGWTPDASWEVTRALVCAAADDAYTEARTVAAAHRARDGVFAPRLRAASAFAFPDEPWANEDLRDALARPDAGQTVGHWAIALASASDPALVRRVLGVPAYSPTALLGYAPDLVLSLPIDDAIEIFSEWLDHGLAQKRNAPIKTWLHDLGAALGAIDDDRVAARLAPLITHHAFGPGAVAYFERFPHLAARHLASLAKKDDEPGRAAAAIVAASAHERVEEAAPSEVPELLRSRPWRVARARTRPPSPALEPPPFVERVEWAPGERERLVAEHMAYREMTDAERSAFEADPDREHVADVWLMWSGHPIRLPHELALARWNGNPDAHASALHVLAVHGAAALPGLFLRTPFLYGGEDEVFVAYLHAVSPRVAVTCAETLQRRKAWRPRALRWLADHPDATVAGLLPLAVGPRGEQAASALRVLAATGSRDLLLDAAAALGEAYRATLEWVLDADPLSELVVTGKLPPFVGPARLPRPRLASGRALPADALEALLDILRATTLDPPYAGLALVREACEPASLLELAEALARAWLLAGAPARHAWALASLAHLAADHSCAEEAVRTLAPLAREWGHKDAKKAALACEILAVIGTDSALLVLMELAERARMAAAKEAASAALRAIAEARGFTVQELEDRALPDLGLDPDGTVTLDFGARRFTVSLDELLRPRIRDAEGRVLTAFPRASKADDPVKAKRAQQRFRALREDASALAANLLRRFERAMTAGRTWRAEDFERLLVRHPIAGSVVRRLVWAELAADHAIVRTFRVAEDLSLADADDHALVLTPDAIVALPHPLSLEAPLRERWIEVFGDYDLVQPFEQLGRAIMSPEPSELASDRIARIAGRRVPAGVVLGVLGARGWAREGDREHVEGFHRTLRTSSGASSSPATATIALSPGFSPKEVASAPLQRMDGVRLAGVARWADVHPIDLAEVLRDLDSLGR